MPKSYATVVVNLPPIRGVFDYHLPESFKGFVSPGCLVTVPFGNRTVQGIVVATPNIPAVHDTKPVESLIDPNPVVTPEQIELAYWMAGEYHAALSECLSLMLPPGVSQRADYIYRLVAAASDGKTPTEKKLLSLLDKRGELRGRQLARAMPRQNWRYAANALVRRNVLDRQPVLDAPKARPKRIRNARLITPPDSLRENLPSLGRPGSQAAERRKKIVDLLIKEGEPINVSWLYAETGGNRADLRMLEDREIIALSEAEVWRDPLEEIDFVPSLPPALTHDQDLVWSRISPSIKAASGGDHIPPYVLHGVTGSGKTEIYMRAVHETLGMGRRAILLVPEIALTPQTIRRFLARFPGQVGLSHSQLSAGERYDTWRRCRAGQIDIVIGPRSALFLPVRNVGLIVLDESHDDSYKEQERSPRYHTRNVAVKYSSILGALCILGSATPDLVTTYHASRGKYHLLSMPRRILGHRERVDGQSERLGIQTNYVAHDGDSSTIDLPPVRVVDMRQELRAGNRSIFSRPLGKALSDVLESNEQAILFLNRRGSSTYVFCRDCGWVARCPHCDNPLIYHKNQDLLTCHHCGHQTASRSECPECGGSRVRYFGAGTKRIVDELQSLFPDVRILRWDRDATRQKGAHDVLLANFAAHRADVLVGTQMISKGLDLPLVTLVGVVSADVGLNLPDYRASERVFQILTQVAGRAGRGLLGGQVILQTYQPEHYVIKAASNHDYYAFYNDEVEHRRVLHYPPFSRMARLIFRATSRDAVESQTGRMAKYLKHRIEKDRSQDELIGPVPCFFERIRGEYRWQIIIRGNDPASIMPDELGESWQIDIDPVSLL